MKPTSPHFAFNLLFAGIAFLMLYTSLPYLGMFVLAFVFVVITYPWYEQFVHIIKNRGLAALLTTLAAVAVLLLPLYFFLVLAVDQILTFGTDLQNNLAQNPEDLLAIQERLNTLIPMFNIADNATTILGSIVTFIQNLVVPLVSNGVTIAMNSVFFILTVVYFYLDKDRFVAFLKRMTPLPKAEGSQLVDRIMASIKTIIQSIAVSAFAQALVSVFALALVDVPALLFWFFALFFCAFLPLGSGIISVPISFILMVSGNFWGGLFVLVWHTVAVSSIDNVIRARMFKTSAIRLPELVTLLASLGGLLAFGFFGIIYGPLVAIIFIAFLEIYQKNNAEQHTLHQDS
jgi:predicted PurR-regulated permease PerM